MAKGSGSGSGPTNLSLKQIRSLIESEKYQQASELLLGLIEIAPSDEARRIFLECCFKLEPCDYTVALKIIEAIQEKNPADYFHISSIRFYLEDFEGAERAIDTCLLLQESPRARSFKATILKGNKASSYHCDEPVRKRIREELARATTLPNCPEESYIELADLMDNEEEIVLLKQAILDYPQYENVRLRYAERISSVSPDAAIDIVEPLLKKRALKALALAVFLEKDRKNFEAALAHLDRFADEEKKKPGYLKVRGDLLFAIGKWQEAIKEFDQEIGSSNIRSQIIGLFSRAQLHFKSDCYSEAVQDAQNALRLCFEYDEFDFTTEAFWLPCMQYYSYGEAMLFMCKALDINDSEKISSCDETTRWRARFLTWVQNYHIRGIEASDQRIKDFSGNLSHPFISRILSEFFHEEGNIFEAVRHHFIYARQRVEHNGQKKPLTILPVSFYLDDANLPKKTASLKIHKLAKSELQNIQRAEEIECIFLPFYRSIWRPILWKNQLYNEARPITEILFKFAAADINLLWDFAYTHATSRKIGDLQSAEWGYLEVIRREPACSSAMNNLSILLERQGRQGEACEYAEQAYVLEPTNANYADRFNKVVIWKEQRKREQEKIDAAQRIIEERLSHPEPFESLTLRQRLYLSALLRTCLSEDQGTIFSIEESSGKLAPSQEYENRILSHLCETGAITLDLNSKLDSYSFCEKKTLNVRIRGVRWKMNIASTSLMDRSTIIGVLCEPPEVSEDEIEEAIELWREIALEESLEYLQHKRSVLNLYANIGEKTRQSFSELLNWFSTSQIYSIIWNVIPKTLAGFEEGKFESRAHAANYIPGRCKGYGEYALNMRWNLPRYKRDFKCEQSMISEILFNRYLMIGPLGFDNKPGDFSTSRISVVAPPIAEKKSVEEPFGPPI